MHPKLKELEEAAIAAGGKSWVYDDLTGFVLPLPDGDEVCQTWDRNDCDFPNCNNSGKFIARANPDTVLKLVSIIHRFMLFQNGMGIVYHQMTEELNQLGTPSTGSANNE